MTRTSTRTYTTIAVTPATRDALFSEKTGPRDTYEDVVRRLLERPAPADQREQDE
ncbi:hypothetical protein ACFQPA_06915 [Halomarina halobia]|uniref:CopG family transcriptional regulator n=1 Tax=Halomarina halobia TaxID=3033386 RepID=A0ABD6ADC0_9EURY|nr:hypothetical protein [Halomarina sp. PSR21]